jgi:amino acid transporter
MEVLIDQDKINLKRTLSVWDLIVYGMVYMLPIAPFAMFGIIGNVSNGLVPLVYFLSLIVMLFTARSYMVLSAEFPLAGSSYTYTQKGLNDFAGFLTGWVVFLDYIISPGFLCIVSAAAMNSLVPAIPRLVWILVFVGAGTGLNLVGVNVTAKYNRIFLYIMLAVLLVYMGASIHALYSGKGHGGLTFASLYSPKTFTWGGVGVGILIGSSNFLGFDAVTTLGEEVKHDHKHLLGFAGMATLLIIGFLFITQTWVTADLAPGAIIKSPDVAFYDIAYYAGGNWLFALTSISTAVAFGIPCTIVSQSAISRIIYAMGREGQLPRILARLHPKTQQPYVANLFVAAVSLVIALAFRDRLDELALFQNFGALTAFALVNASLIGYFWFKKRQHNIIRHMIMPLIGLAIIGVLIIAMRSTTFLFGCIWVACGLTYYSFMRFALGRKVALDV